jgi:hypothetical protein
LTIDTEKLNIRVLIHGLQYFCQKLPAFLESEGWEFRNYPPRWSKDILKSIYQLQRCDLAYTWGGRLTFGKFLTSAKLLGKQKIVMFWCGSDVLHARVDFKAGRTEAWIAEKVHWAGAPWLADEVRAMGLKCEFVPSTWISPVKQLAPLPEKFSVLSYLPDAKRTDLYGIDQVLEVARAMPQIDFSIVGLLPGQTLRVPPNVALHGRVAEMESFYRNATVIWRPARHDGLSFMSLEALARGRHVIWSYPFDGAFHSKNATTARIELERLLELHQAKKLEPNIAGAEFIAEHFSPEKIKKGILSRWKSIVDSAALPMNPSLT